MLCTKIIFTNDNMTCAQRFSDFLHGDKIKHKVYSDEDSSEVEADSDDEGLYDICCEITNYVKEKSIKASVSRFLYRHYACFNSDESKIICSNVFKRDFISELPGRMYIYLKIRGSINPFAFYDFMCKDIDKKAKDAAVEEADRILAMNDNSDFIDLLKNFASFSMESFDKVELTADSTGLRITSCCPDEADVCTEYAADEEDILAELVTMNPKQIEILGKEEFLKNEISAVIIAVFEDRIQYK